MHLTYRIENGNVTEIIPQSPTARDYRLESCQFSYNKRKKAIEDFKLGHSKERPYNEEIRQVYFEELEELESLLK
jgi:hypothetical protein